MTFFIENVLIRKAAFVCYNKHVTESLYIPYYLLSIIIQLNPKSELLDGDRHTLQSSASDRLTHDTYIVLHQWVDVSLDITSVYF